MAIGRELDALLGEDPRPAAIEVTGRLRADRGADGYVLHLEVALAGQREARELRANDCTVLARAGVLVAAVTVDALAGSAVRRRAVADLWVGVAAGTGIAFWATRRFALQARVEGVLGARRPAMFLVIDGEPREAFRMLPVGARLLVGPLVRLW